MSPVGFPRKEPLWWSWSAKCLLRSGTNTRGREGSRDGQREKLSCDGAPVAALVIPRGSSPGARRALCGTLIRSMALSLCVGHSGSDLGQSVPTAEVMSDGCGTANPLLFRKVYSSSQPLPRQDVTCSFAACDNDVVILENTQMFLKTCKGGVRG